MDGISVNDLQALKSFITALSGHEQALSDLTTAMNNTVAGAADWWKDQKYDEFKEAWLESSAGIGTFLQTMPDTLAYLSGYAQDIEAALSRRIPRR